MSEVSQRHIFNLLKMDRLKDDVINLSNSDKNET